MWRKIEKKEILKEKHEIKWRRVSKSIRLRIGIWI